MAGRVVVIVGGTSGIGLAAALRFAAQGDDLVLAARDPDALASAQQQAVEAGAGRVDVCPTDVRDAEAVDRLLARCLELHGHVDVLVSTAATMAYGAVDELPAEVFTAVVDTAVHGTANLARVFVPEFRRRRRGTFVIVNSLLGTCTVPWMGAYTTAKWGQLAIARTLQQELRDERDVHVCVVSPGSTNTPIYYQSANYTGRAARPPVPVLQPGRAAAVITGLADRPRRSVSVRVGPVNPLITLGFRLLPPLYDLLVGPLARIAALTRTPRDVGPGNVLTPAADAERVHGHWPTPPNPGT